MQYTDDWSTVVSTGRAPLQPRDQERDQQQRDQEHRDQEQDQQQREQRDREQREQEQRHRHSPQLGRLFVGRERADTDTTLHHTTNVLWNSPTVISRAGIAPRMQRFTSDPLDNRLGRDSPGSPIYYDESTKSKAWFTGDTDNIRSSLFRQPDFGNENNINNANANNLMSTRGQTNKSGGNDENDSSPSFSEGTPPNKNKGRARSASTTAPATPASGFVSPSTPPMYSAAPGGSIWHQQRRNSVSGGSTYSTASTTTPSNLHRNYGSAHDNNFGSGGHHSSYPRDMHHHVVSRSVRAYSEPEGHQYGRGSGGTGNNSGGVYFSPSGVPPPGFRGATSPRVAPEAPLRPLFLGNTPSATRTATKMNRLNVAAPAWSKQRSATSAITMSSNSYDGDESRYNSRTGWSSEEEELSSTLAGMSINGTSTVPTRSNINPNTTLGPLPRLCVADVERIILRVHAQNSNIKLKPETGRFARRPDERMAQMVLYEVELRYSTHAEDDSTRLRVALFHGPPLMNDGELLTHQMCGQFVNMRMDRGIEVAMVKQVHGLCPIDMPVDMVDFRRVLHRLAPVEAVDVLQAKGNLERNCLRIVMSKLDLHPQVQRLFLPNMHSLVYLQVQQDGLKLTLFTENERKVPKALFDCFRKELTASLIGAGLITERCYFYNCNAVAVGQPSSSVVSEYGHHHHHFHHEVNNINNVPDRRRPVPRRSHVMRG